MTDALITALLWAVRVIAWDTAFIVGTWVLYLAVMNLAGNRDELTGLAKWLAYGLVLPIGYACDIVLNLHFCLFALWRPRNWLLTGTLKRIRAEEAFDARRRIVATYICANLLNPFDPKGTHC